MRFHKSTRIQVQTRRPMEKPAVKHPQHSPYLPAPQRACSDSTREAVRGVVLPCRAPTYLPGPRGATTWRVFPCSCTRALWRRWTEWTTAYPSATAMRATPSAARSVPAWDTSTHAGTARARTPRWVGGCVLLRLCSLTCMCDLYLCMCDQSLLCSVFRVWNRLEKGPTKKEMPSMLCDIHNNTFLFVC